MPCREIARHGRNPQPGAPTQTSQNRPQTVQESCCEESREIRQVASAKEKGSLNPHRHRLVRRTLALDDYDAIREMRDTADDRAGGACTAEPFRSQLARFPEGRICIEDRGRVVAAAPSLTVD